MAAPKVGKGIVGNVGNVGAGKSGISHFSQKGEKKCSFPQESVSVWLGLQPGDHLLQVLPSVLAADPHLANSLLSAVLGSRVSPMSKAQYQLLDQQIQ